MNPGSRISEKWAYSAALLIAIAISIMYSFNQSNTSLLDISADVSLLIFFGTFAVSALTVAQIGVRRNEQAKRLLVNQL